MANKKDGTVLFLGAGASRACGYLQTSEILPRILKLLGKEPKKIQDVKLRKKRRTLMADLGEFVPGAVKRRGAEAALQSLSITGLLSLLDHAIRTGEEFASSKREEDVDGNNLREVRELLHRAIVEVLRQPAHEQVVKPERLVDWVLDRQKAKDPVAIISTNYDVSFDFEAFHKVLGDWMQTYPDSDFGFCWRDPDDGAIVPPASSPALRLYKLHGSLNWMGCPRCGFIYVSFMFVIAGRDADSNWDMVCHCGWSPVRSVLVAPSLARDIRDPNLLSVWLKAGEALRTAKRWIFVGYSLPQEDLAIRSMLVRAYHGANELKPEVFVVDLSPDKAGKIAPVPVASYQSFFTKVRWRGDGLGGFLDVPNRWKTT